MKLSDFTNQMDLDIEMIETEPGIYTGSFDNMIFKIKMIDVIDKKSDMLIEKITSIVEQDTDIFYYDKENLHDYLSKLVDDKREKYQITFIQAIENVIANYELHKADYVFKQMKLKGKR